MKRKIVVILLALLFTLSFTNNVFADVDVKGYYRSDGTYVAPYKRSNPDGNFNNNWSTEGNVNPYTGKKGTKEKETNWSSNGGYYNGQYYQIAEQSDEMAFADYLWFGFLGFIAIWFYRAHRQIKREESQKKKI
jgi:hypothetical protein